MTSTMPTVSVIVPMYNASSFVEAAVGQILDQSFGDFEVIIVDDKSTDATAERAREATNRDERISLIELPQNGGVAHARNTAVMRAKGKYLWFVDVDDEWSPEFLTRAVALAQASGADVVVCSAVHRHGARQVEEFVVRYTDERVLDGPEAVECMVLGSGALWNKLIRREIVGDSPFPPLRSKSDHGGVLRITKSVTRVATLPDVLYTYVQRDGSISNGGVAEPQNFLALLELGEESLDELPASAQSRRLRSRFRSMIIARAIRESWRFSAASDELPRTLPKMISWNEILPSVFDDPRTFITCVGAKASPRLAYRAFRYLGRSRWTANGAN